jgi:hypothetical protein
MCFGRADALDLNTCWRGPSPTEGPMVWSRHLSCMYSLQVEVIWTGHSALVV